MSVEYDQIEVASPNGKPLRFLARRGTNDLNVVYSAAAADEYRLRGLQFEGWAIDMGTHVGGVAIGLAADNPGLHVICIEPVPDNAELIRRHAEINDVGDQITVLELAVGAPGTTTLVRYGFRGGDGDYDHHAWVGNASMVYADPPVEAHDEKEVGCVDLAQLARSRATLGPPALVKVDCEGGEWDALEQIVALDSPRVVGEWHPVMGRTAAGELVDAFETAGYAVELTGPAAGPGGFFATR